MDFIGNFLTSIRNANLAGKSSCMYKWSIECKRITEILQDGGFIKGYKEKIDPTGHKYIKIYLKYVQGEPALVNIKRHSKPGRRLYCGYKEIPRASGGLGINILTTSKGIMKDGEARLKKCGGEIICTVW